MNRTITEIDTELASIYEAIYKAQHALQIAQLHLAVAQDSSVLPPDPDTVQKCSDKVEAVTAEVQTLAASTLPHHDEFDRRGGWTRFFLAKSSGGHIHSSMSCSTCNKGLYGTEFGWLPELSGLSEADAVKAHGAVLCTVCYPSAPVEWTDGRRPGRCPGSGTSDYPVETARMGYYAGNYGLCSHCGGTVTLTRTNRLRAHKPA